jgi:hypothetical protein
MYWADEAKLGIAKRLKEVFGNDLVKVEWRSHAKNEEYMIGNFINASILGKIGIVIVNGSNEKVWQNAERVMKFLEGASAHKKIPGITKNTMLFEYSQFMDRLDKARSV